MKKQCKVHLVKEKRNCESPLKKGSEYCARHSKLWENSHKSREANK